MDIAVFDWADPRSEDAVAIRTRVFIEEQGIPSDLELDGKDEESIHFLASDPEPVATARARSTENTLKVERVAVLPEARDQGYGRNIMEAVESYAHRQGFEELLVHAQLAVVDFYERIGFEAVGDSFDEAGIPHRKMRKRI